MTLLRTMASLALMMVAAPYASASSPGSAPNEASPRGDASALQAFGDDPTWTVVVDAGGMSMAVEERGEPVFRELPAPLVSQTGSGRVLNLNKPVALQFANASWPTVAGNVATYALANDDETVTASATLQAASCTANGKTYLLTLALVVDGQTYRSCASQAYLNLPMLSPPTVANPF